MWIDVNRGSRTEPPMWRPPAMKAPKPKYIHLLTIPFIYLRSDPHTPSIIMANDFSPPCYEQPSPPCNSRFLSAPYQNTSPLHSSSAPSLYLDTYRFPNDSTDKPIIISRSTPSAHQ